MFYIEEVSHETFCLMRQNVSWDTFVLLTYFIYGRKREQMGIAVSEGSLYNFNLKPAGLSSFTSSSPSDLRRRRRSLALSA